MSRLVLSTTDKVAIGMWLEKNRDNLRNATFADILEAVKKELNLPYITQAHMVGMLKSLSIEYKQRVMVYAPRARLTEHDDMPVIAMALLAIMDSLDITKNFPNIKTKLIAIEQRYCEEQE